MRTSALVAAACGAGALAWYLYSRNTSAAPSRATQKDRRGSLSAAKGASDSTVGIFFGSQTGTAEEFSNTLREELQKMGGHAETVDLENFDDESDLTNYKVCIFLVATYGEGDPTDNAVGFEQWLQKSPDGLLRNGVKYCTFALGNKQYVNFNKMGKYVDADMARIGGVRVCELGIGDDDADIEEDFETWKKENLFPALMELHEINGMDSVEQDDAASVLKKLPLVAEVNAKKDALPIDASVQGTTVLTRGYFHPPSTVKKVTELRQDVSDGVGTVQVDFNISGMKYETADTADLIPENDPELVEHFAKLLNVKASDYLSLVKNAQSSEAAKKLFPTPCTIRESLARYCDLLKVPNKASLKLFALFCSEKDQENMQKVLASDWLVKDFESKDTHLSFAEFLQMFMPSLKMDIGTFVQLCPRQKPRSYTISSSSAENKEILSVTVGLVKKPLKNLAPFLAKLKSSGIAFSEAPHGNLAKLGADREYLGIASSWLYRMKKLKSVSSAVGIVSVHKSSFRLPENPKCPIIMIGAGTGCAPFRGFVRELAVKPTKRKCMLIFGCQRSDKDYIYKEELESAKQSGVLTHLVTAFSREQEKKIYVQDRVAENGKIVKELFDEGAVIYICGATAMGNSVLKAIQGALGREIKSLRGTRIVEEFFG
jgi:NADPH-ferrihemoprotein reductase